MMMRIDDQIDRLCDRAREEAARPRVLRRDVLDRAQQLVVARESIGGIRAPSSCAISASSAELCVRGYEPRGIAGRAAFACSVISAATRVGLNGGLPLTS